MKTRAVFYGAAVSCALIGLLLTAVAAGSTQGRSDSPSPAAQATDDPPQAVNHDVSPPLRQIAPAPGLPADQKKEKEPKKGLPVP